MKITCVRGVASVLCLMVLAVAGAGNGAAQKGGIKDDNPDLVEIRNYKLSMDKVNKLMTAGVLYFGARLVIDGDLTVLEVYGGP